MTVRKLLPARITLRARLTLIYGGLFLVAGVVLLGTTYALFNQQLGSSSLQLVTVKATPSPVGTPASGDGGPPPETEAMRWMQSERQRVHDAATTSLLTQGSIALGLVGVAAAGFGWLVAGRVLAPLHQVTETARRIAAAPVAGGGLHERISLRGRDDEVKDLADSLNTMLERLDRSFDGQRRFIAHASHELRTPLTVGRALVELALNRKTASADTKQLGESLLQINTRHEQLITGLLLLATSENELTDRRPMDLADVAAYVVAQAGPQASRAGIALHDKLDEALTTGDALLLERLVYNLVENGILYNTQPDGWVRVVTRAGDDGQVEVEVSNTGPVVSPYEVPALFEPFHRLGDHRQITAKGAGLGLSVVRSVAATHGGRATATAREEGGLIVTITLPAQPDDGGSRVGRAG
jgi:signal transduction histidine kinase